jgi:hypothetical protein
VNEKSVKEFKEEIKFYINQAVPSVAVKDFIVVEQPTDFDEVYHSTGILVKDNYSRDQMLILINKATQTMEVEMDEYTVDEILDAGDFWRIFYLYNWGKW